MRVRFPPPAPMHASMTTTQGTSEDLAAMAGETMVEWLRDLEGFEGLVMLSNDQTGTTHVISFWESKQVAERSRVARLKLRDRITSTVGVEVRETEAYEVAFAHLSSFRDAARPD